MARGKKGFLNEIVDMDDPFTIFANDDSTAIGSVNYIDTGSYILNAAFSTSLWGGVPDNSVTAFAGEESVGKSYYALGILKQFLSKDERAGGILYETEGAPKQVIRSRGIDGARVIISQPDTIQKFAFKALNTLDKYEQIEESERPPLMMILDSLGGLSTTKELEDTLSGKEVKDMTRQQAAKAAFRQITLKLEKVHVPMIITNHVHVDITKYGAPKVVSGGSGLKYAASTIAMLTASKEKNEDKDVIGSIITVKFPKNRYAKQYTEVETRLLFDKGLDRYYGLIDLAVKYDIIKKAPKGYTMPDGTAVSTKELDREPEKYYTKDILERLEEAAKKEFAYGIG